MKVILHSEKFEQFDKKNASAPHGTAEWERYSIGLNVIRITGELPMVHI